MKHGSVSIVLELSSVGSRDAWIQTLESFRRQTLSVEDFELLLVGSEEQCRYCDSTSFPALKIISSGSSFRKKEAVLSQARFPLILFVEEPVHVGQDFLEKVTALMVDSAVVAVQPRIEAHEGRQPGMFPERAGMKRIFQVPFLDGRVTLVRKEALIAAGGFASLPRLALWMDLSWRMMKREGFIRSTELVSVSLLGDRIPLSALFNVLHQGVSRAFFVARWRVFLMPRWKRILVRFKEQWRLRFSTLRGQLQVHAVPAILAGTALGAVRDLTTGLTLLPALCMVRRVCLPEAEGVPIYSGAFMYADDYSAYVTRVSIFNQVGLLDRHYHILRTLLQERISDLQDDSLRQRFSSEDIAALKQMDVLHSGSR